MANVVVWDPRGDVLEGALVDDEAARQLRVRGVALLPVEPELLRINALAGFSKRAWGSGWPFPSASPGRVGMLGAYLHHDLPALHWVARVTPSAEAYNSSSGLLRLSGDFRLSPDHLQHGAMTADIDQAERSAVRAEDLVQPDDFGGWTVGGVVRSRQTMDGYVGLSLHGAARGLRLVWLAVSQTRNGAG